MRTKWQEGLNRDAGLLTITLEKAVDHDTCHCLLRLDSVYVDW